MVILEFYQGDYQKDLATFDSLEEGRAFVAQIPGYTLEAEDGFEVVNNDKVKTYVEAREANYGKVKDFLERNGYEADRSFFGSEDGEAILYRKRGAEDWYFLCHLDPLFVDIEDVEGYVKEEIQSLN